MNHHRSAGTITNTLNSDTEEPEVERPTMTDYTVVGTDELPPGEHVVVQLEGRLIGVYNVDGEYYAYTNWCPHQGGPVCEGALDGTTEITFDRSCLERSTNWVKEDEVLRCPWHAWEFDILSGEAMHDHDIRLISHETKIEDDNVVISL